MFQILQKGETVPSRKHHIHQRKSDLFFPIPRPPSVGFNPGLCGMTVHEAHRLIARRLQIHSDQFQDGLFIFNDQYPVHPFAPFPSQPERIRSAAFV